MRDIGNFKLTGHYLKRQKSRRAEEQKIQLMVELAQCTPIQGQPDISNWNWKKKKDFKVNSFYLGMDEGPYIRLMVTGVWGLKARTRVATFTWLMLKNRILTIDNLVKRVWIMPNRCPLCKRAEETINHMYMHFTYTIAVKQATAATSLFLGQNRKFVDENYRDILLQKGGKVIKQMQVALCFVIWRQRGAKESSLTRKNRWPCWL